MDTDTQRPAAKRITLALLAATLYASLSYALAQTEMWESGLFSFTFTVLQPAAICAFVAFLGDPFGHRPLSYYLWVPVVLGVGFVVVGGLILQEGLVCIVMLLPVWWLSGIAGTAVLYNLQASLRDEEGERTVFKASALLALPLALIPLEQSLPMPSDRYTVSQSVEIDAPRDRIWALMQTVGTIAPEEGHWNVTQSVIGVPRPISAALEGQGEGSVRHAQWEAGIAFEEHITQWSDGKQIVWDFVFPQSDAWDFTDSHLHPNSEHMTIETGGYLLEEIAPGRMKLTLHTSYRARTRINPYASVWGRFFLGDIQSNILALIKDRAEG